MATVKYTMSDKRSENRVSVENPREYNTPLPDLIYNATTTHHPPHRQQKPPVRYMMIAVVMLVVMINDSSSRVDVSGKTPPSH